MGNTTNRGSVQIPIFGFSGFYTFIPYLLKMLTKNLLRFPELLLLLSLAIAPFFCGVSTLDVHFHDTYYVLGAGATTWALIYGPFFILLFISWIFHVLLRLHGPSAGGGRTVQALVSVVCFWVVILSIGHPNLFYEMPRRYIDYSTSDNFYRPMFRIGIIATVVLALLQFSFWIVASVMLFKSRMGNDPAQAG